MTQLNPIRHYLNIITLYSLFFCECYSLSCCINRKLRHRGDKMGVAPWIYDARITFVELVPESMKEERTKSSLFYPQNTHTTNTLIARHKCRILYFRGATPGVNAP